MVIIILINIYFRPQFVYDTPFSINSTRNAHMHVNAKLALLLVDNKNKN